MRELINDPFYEMIEKYNRCIIDYCLIKDDTPYQGYRSHMEAIQFSMCKVMERANDYRLKVKSEYSPEDLDDELISWSVEIEKAESKLINPVSFLYVPDESELRNAKNGGQIPYWYAFLKTPHNTGYGLDDFKEINELLFPNGAESLEVYEWNTDWSNYFDDGHEWWGAACFSVYDKSLNRLVVIMASTTD